MEKNALRKKRVESEYACRLKPKLEKSKGKSAIDGVQNTNLRMKIECSRMHNVFSFFN